MSVYPEPQTEGHFCKRCGIHRTRTATGLCPSCLDDDKRAERIAATPRPAP